MQDASHDVPKSPDNASIRTHSTLATSSSAASYISTIRYDHESYEGFSKRVESLCQILWHQQKSLKHLILNSRAVRANKTFGSFVPSKQTPLIERLSGGDYNRITGITLPPSYGTEGRELILRTPRGDEGRQERDLAILSYVRQWTSIPVPTIAAKDFSCDNPLGMPYVLQRRIPGTNLSTVWDDLSHSQRWTVARELSDVKKDIATL